MAPRGITMTLLALTTALGTVGMCLGINALVGSIHDKGKVRKVTPKNVSVTLDDSDIVASGAVLSVGCGFLALASFISLGLLWFRPNRKTRTQALAVGFFTVWVLATAASTLALALHGSVKVSAMIGKTKVPDALVAAAEKAAGVSRVYWEHSYLRPAVIVPFIIFLLGVLSTIALFTTKPVESAPTHEIREVREKKGGSDTDSA